MKSLIFAASLAGIYSASAAPNVLIKTNMGEIKIELNSEKAPITVANFLKYVEQGHYDKTVFHRVINQFMIQGGGFQLDNGTLTEKVSGKPIANEGKNGLKNERGTISMARMFEPNSAKAQFFINVVDNKSLDYPSNNGGYAVFGKVISGLEIIDKIKKVQTVSSTLMSRNPGSNDLEAVPSTDVPAKPIIIDSIKVEK